MTGHEKDMKVRVAQNVSAAIDASGLSSAEIARRLGRNEKTIRRWRSGEATPDIERLAELAAALGDEAVIDVLDFYREPEKEPTS